MMHTGVLGAGVAAVGGADVGVMIGLAPGEPGASVPAPDPLEHPARPQRPLRDQRSFAARSLRGSVAGAEVGATAGAAGGGVGGGGGGGGGALPMSSSPFTTP